MYEPSIAPMESGAEVLLMCILPIIDQAVFKKSIAVPPSWALPQVVFQHNSRLWLSKVLLEGSALPPTLWFSQNLTFCFWIRWGWRAFPPQCCFPLAWGPLWSTVSKSNHLTDSYVRTGSAVLTSVWILNFQENTTVCFLLKSEFWYLRWRLIRIEAWISKSDCFSPLCAESWVWQGHRIHEAGR